MNFETQFSSFDIQILQSVLHTLDTSQKQISKLKLTLQFDDQQKYNKFVNRFKPIPNQDEDIISQSDSEDDKNKQDKQHINLQIYQQNGSVQEVHDEEKLTRMELSIILKQNYKEEIQAICKNNNVRILIVPEKLKYFGYCYKDIEEAMDQVHKIKNNITISCLESGKQIYQSNFLRDKLKQSGIKLGRLAQKYYYWYQQSMQNYIKIQQTLQQIFHHKKHILYPLLQNYQHLKRRHNPKYIQALIKANAKLYTQYVEQQINEHKDDHKVQLNCYQNQVIIHVSVQQQSQIVKIQLRKFYKQIIQFFIHYKLEENGDIKNFAEIQKILNEKNILWTRHEDLIVISLYFKNNKQFNMYNQNSTINPADRGLILQKIYKQFLQNIKPIFNQNTNCSIQYLNQKDYNDGQNINKSLPWQNKIIVQYKNYDGIYVISPKNQRVPLILDIIHQFVLKRNAGEKKQRNSQQSMINNTNVQNTNTRIQDTTSNIEYSQQSVMEGMQGQRNNILPKQQGNGKQQQQQRQLLSEIRQNKFLKNYSFYFPDLYGEKKYYDSPSQVTKGKLVKTTNRQQLQQLLQLQTKRIYKLYSVSIPSKLKIQTQLPTQNNVNDPIVTVFVRDDEKQQFKRQQKIKCYLITDSKTLQSDGWLLNLRKSDLKENQYKYQVSRNKLQVILYVKFIEKEGK